MMHANQRYTQLTDELRKELSSLIAGAYYVAAVVGGLLTFLLSFYLLGPYFCIALLTAWVGICVPGYFAMRWVQRVFLKYMEWRTLSPSSSPKEEPRDSYEYAPTHHREEPVSELPVYAQIQGYPSQL